MSIAIMSFDRKYWFRHQISEFVIFVVNTRIIDFTFQALCIIRLAVTVRLENILELLVLYTTFLDDWALKIKISIICLEKNVESFYRVRIL